MFQISHRFIRFAFVAAALPAITLGPTQEALAQTTSSGSTRNSAFFKKAKQDLPEPYYFLYRIIDRLARANGLDTGPWRVIRIPEYNMNAFAGDVNLIAVYTGLLDVLAGDSDAMACVVGHEMAHHVKRHIPLGKKDQVLANQRLEAKKDQIVKREKRRQANAQGWALIGGIIGAATGVNLPINPAGVTDPEKINQELEEAKDAEQDSLALSSRNHEFEADREGYLYMARAGFDPRGCLRMMDVLGRTPGAEFDTTHPAIPRRIEELNTLMVQMPHQKLAAEGKARLQASNALTYAVSADQNSLRVNSRFGSAKGGFIMNDL
jgi:predicted Zn-dependent protease